MGRAPIERAPAKAPAKIRTKAAAPIERTASTSPAKTRTKTAAPIERTAAKAPAKIRTKTAAPIERTASTSPAKAPAKIRAKATAPIERAASTSPAKAPAKIRAKAPAKPKLAPGEAAPGGCRVLAYANAVLSGEVIAGPHVRNACQRHISDLARTDGIFFCRDSAEHAFRYFENVLKLSEGQFEGLPFQLHPSQAFILGSLFGWKRQTGLRRFRRAYIEQGKGNGKSPVAGGIGLYGMTATKEAGAQIYAAAAKKDQAQILFQDACKMVRAAPALKKRLSFSGGLGKEFNIAHLKSGSFFRPVSRDTGRTGSGPRPYFVLADEVHEMPDRSILEMLERGFKFRREPLLFMITNSGSDRNSVAWEEHAHAVKVAAGNNDALTDNTFLGEVIDDTTFSYVCSLDKGDDPLEDPKCWVKANPLLGVTLTDEYLREVVQQAKAIPGSRNGILRLHFCVWTDAAQAWMARETLEPCLADFDPAEIHAGADIYLGTDLSQNQDITAIAAVVKTGLNDAGAPLYDAWVEAWTPGDTLAARQKKDKLPYDVWRDSGFIHAPPGKSINFAHVAQTVFEYNDLYSIALMGYDSYAFKKFETEVEKLKISIPFAEHPQGGLKKGAPLVKGGEGLWMPGSLRLLEDAMLEGRIRIRRNPVLISAMMSAVPEHDKWGNYWLAKTKSLNKIDAAVALAMAIGCANAGVSPAKKKFQMMVV